MFFTDWPLTVHKYLFAYNVTMSLDFLRKQIEKDPLNQWATERGWKPVYTAGPKAKILIVGQAPGIRAQSSETPWNDKSGDNLRSWMGVDRETFYDTDKIALVPMDFYFPGNGIRGDLPPRPGFAEKWHPLLLAEMPNIELKILVGQYSHRYYLGKACKGTLSQTVASFREYLPDLLPLVHPSPRNNIWHKKNPWFKEEIVPVLKERVGEILDS